MKTSALHIPDEFIDELVANIKDGRIKTKAQLVNLKKRLAKKYGIKDVPSNSILLEYIDDEEIRQFLIRKPVRTISGVAVLAVMTSPHPCPHGRCIPCPGGPPYSPQSYTGKEPAAMRAERNNFNPYLQTIDRLNQFRAIGHPVDKIDVIVMGGTFPARDFHYQEWFVKRIYDALNGRNSRNLEEAKRLNESARSRCIGLTIETRPDWCRMQHVDWMLHLGATRVEIGAQILDDEVLYLMKRGHTVLDTISATQIARDAGMKITYHIMPGLPGSSYEKDLNSFIRMFRDERFRPDMLKIYPTLVVKPSILYNMWKRGEYEPLNEEEAVELIAEMKKHVPEWVRIQRIERDIPSNLIEAGIKKSNLRQIVHERLKEMGERCRCIRCREIGHNWYKKGIESRELYMVRREYMANGGREIFLSFEDTENDLIAAYCRLRLPYKPHREEMDGSVAVVRELKVHGPMVEIGEKPRKEWQHRGLGARLMEEAENIVIRFKKERLLVLSGIGVKEYYRKLGYVDNGVYMEKVLE
ncbi:MAG: tRNA uridine(34) 5-carboxymethylaminomethyl modification radical SAM/GNAT enzyme Elp3 [Thermoplasmata archaeon]|nr:tRNA uridine(34) 5-carboxymethylaminomethyl modification radical SAM/GNAT enzyme Elp3 [Thermoplasmata archaeon]